MDKHFQKQTRRSCVYPRWYGFKLFFRGVVLSTVALTTFFGTLWAMRIPQVSNTVQQASANAWCAVSCPLSSQACGQMDGYRVRCFTTCGSDADCAQGMACHTMGEDASGVPTLSLCLESLKSAPLLLAGWRIR